MNVQNLNLFQHPRFDKIQNYTAIRLGCDVDDLKKSGTRIVSAIANADENFLEASSVEQLNVISLTQMSHCTIIRKNQNETKAVQNLLQQLDWRNKITPEDLLKFDNVEKKGYSEPYFYLNPKYFKVFPDSNLI